MNRLYTVYLRHPDGALRSVADCQAWNAREALSLYRGVAPDERGPFVVLPALTAAPLLID